MKECCELEWENNMRLGKTHRLSTWVLHMIMFYKEKVFRKLIPIMLVITAYAALVIYLDKYVAFFSRIENSNLSQFHLIFSFVLGIIISFRVTTSYNRWWEGRTLWGSVVNNSRNLALKFNVFVGLKQHPQFQQYLQILPLILKLHLRNDPKTIACEFAKLGLDSAEIANPVLFLVQNLYLSINTLRDKEQIRFEQYNALDMHLVNLVDLIGGCERIANTPVPPAFAFFVKQALLFYSLIFPFGWVDKFGLLIIPMILVIVYILLGLEILAEEIEDPFGQGENDLPLDMIATNIQKNIMHIANQELT